MQQHDLLGHAPLRPRAAVPIYVAGELSYSRTRRQRGYPACSCSGAPRRSLLDPLLWPRRSSHGRKGKLREA